MPRTWGSLLESERELVVEQFITSGRKYHAIDFEGFDLERSANTERRIRYKAERYVPMSQTPDYSKQIVRITGDAVVIGDTEIPDHDHDMINLAIAVGKKQKINTLIVNGDLISADGLSNHKPSAFSPPTSTGQDINTTKGILAVLARCFSGGVYIVTGNHDARMRWATNGQIEACQLFNDGTIQMTPLGYMFLTSGGVEWKITHPKQYSKIPGSVARQIAINESVNVVMAHTHLLSWSITSNGKYVAIDGGHCRDVNKTIYKMQLDTTFPKWCAGFTVIRDGHGFALSKEFTDWRLWT